MQTVGRVNEVQAIIRKEPSVKCSWISSYVYLMMMMVNVAVWWFVEVSVQIGQCLENGVEVVGGEIV